MIDGEMKSSADLSREHATATRRYFLQRMGISAAGFCVLPLWANEEILNPELQARIQKLAYLTSTEAFRNVERHRPLPYKLPLDKRLQYGLERETWKLEVIKDPESNSRLRNPLSNEEGTALDFPGLMKLAEKQSVRFLKVMTCNNIADPLGMGLWEGVPLRDVIWLAKPDKNIRRVFYRGFHNNNPKQVFQSSLPIGRVLEDPPGEQPIILCYKLNGSPLEGQRGGPVRMIVPEAYGFKSIKWIQTIFLTNNHQANDTYAKQDNDIDSQMKSYARFIHWPKSVKAGNPIPITGVAQAGMSGISKVQYWLQPEKEDVPSGDPYFSKADWLDADILPLPPDWKPEEVDQPLSPIQIDSNQQPREWPLRHTIAHWAALIENTPKGNYVLRCRTIDRNGIAQPMPRPFQKSGGNKIQKVNLKVTG